MAVNYSRKPRPAIERFLEKVLKTESCWLWTASKNHGYGAFAVSRRVIVRAHRFSWELFKGPIPTGFHVLHDCPGGDNPACVNPDHLKLGKDQENSDDRMRKNRQVRGSSHGRARLNEIIVFLARQQYAEGARSIRSLAEEYGVSEISMKQAITGERWGHVV